MTKKMKEKATLKQVRAAVAAFGETPDLKLSCLLSGSNQEEWQISTYLAAGADGPSYSNKQLVCSDQAPTLEQACASFIAALQYKFCPGCSRKGMPRAATSCAKCGWYMGCRWASAE